MCAESLTGVNILGTPSDLQTKNLNVQIKRCKGKSTCKSDYEFD